MRVPVTGAPDIKITSRDGQGIGLYQATSRITLSNADVLGLVDAIVETVQRNREGKPCNRRAS